MPLIISLDPGTDKCGLLLVNLEQQTVLDGRVVHSSAVLDLISSWLEQGDLQEIILGNGTSSDFWYKKINDFAPIKVVEEGGTTLRARQRYWELWPPSLWIRWLPKGLIVPPVHLDAVAALVLLEDYLGKKFFWEGPTNFRILHEL